MGGITYRYLKGYGHHGGEWVEAHGALTLRNGSGVHSDPNAQLGYYKLPLEDIMDSFIGDGK